LKDLNSKTRSDQIAHVLRDDILTGRYRVGERLPSERDLAARFHASRGAVREAFRGLEQLGLTTVGHGGARVSALEDANLDIIGRLLVVRDVPDLDLIGQVLEVIGGLYRIALQQMITRATNEELDSVREVIGQLADLSLTAEQQMAVRVRMGELLMEKSHNLLLRLINNSLRTQLVDPNQSGVLPKADASEFLKPVAQLDEAIKARNTEGADQAIGEIAAIDRRLILAAITQQLNQGKSAGAES
jgi:GntR family transcriptional repressor for pyruvate dehydrogenase complex